MSLLTRRDVHLGWSIWELISFRYTENKCMKCEAVMNSREKKWLKEDIIYILVNDLNTIDATKNYDKPLLGE